MQGQNRVRGIIRYSTRTELTDTRCKHFCCRDGLDKPPKASKKQPSSTTPKPDRLNQLTLSATVTKKPAQHGPLKAKADQKPYISPSVLQPSSGNYSLKPSFSSGDPSAIDVNSSSDYGDDSLDDLPSPTALLLGKTMEVAIQGDNKTVAASNAEEDFFLGEDWLFADDEPIRLTQSAVVDPPHRDKVHTRGKWMLENNVNEIQVSLSPENSSTVEDTTVPSCDYPTGRASGTKRKLSLIEVDDQTTCRVKEAKQKTERLKCSEDSNAVLLEVHEEVHDPGQSAVPGPSRVPTDWEDIDPALLDEFKDIINFF